jgi:hypothetical protein
MNESIGWLRGQLDEFLGRQALVPPRKSHRNRLEGAGRRAGIKNPERCPSND